LKLSVTYFFGMPLNAACIHISAVFRSLCAAVPPRTYPVGSANMIILSSLRMVLFMACALPAGATGVDVILESGNVAAQPVGISGREGAAVVKACAGYRMPLMDGGKEWNAYPFGGACLELPAVIRDLSFNITMDIGRLESKPPFDVDVLVVNSGLIFLYNVRMWLQHFSLRPFTGLSNTSVYLIDEFAVDTHIFSHSENEFGVAAGLEPVMAVGRLRFSAPASWQYVFSSPRPFTFFSVSIHCGAAF